MVSAPEKLLENDGTPERPVSNLASTPSFQFKVRWGLSEVPSLKRVFQNPQPVEGRGLLCPGRLPLNDALSSAFELPCVGLPAGPSIWVHEWQRGLGRNRWRRGSKRVMGRIAIWAANTFQGLSFCLIGGAGGGKGGWEGTSNSLIVI